VIGGKYVKELQFTVIDSQKCCDMLFCIWHACCWL